MEVSIPQLNHGLVTEPSHVGKQAVDLNAWLGGAPCVFCHETHHTAFVLGTSSLLRRLDDLWCDDLAVRRRDAGFIELARHTFLDQVSQTKADLGDLLRSNGGLHALMAISWKHYGR